MPGAILNDKADMIMTSIKINSQRKEVLDFTVPFLDTGVTIVVTKRTGIISPTAFLGCSLFHCFNKTFAYCLILLYVLYFYESLKTA